MSPTADTPTPQSVGQLAPIGNFIPSPLNPRTRFTDADLAKLQANISKRHEVLAALLARPAKGKPGHLEIVDGERRWRCAQKANITHLPVTVKQLSDTEALEIMLISAVLAQALTPLEEAEAFKTLIMLGKGTHTFETIGKKFGKDPRSVADRIRLTDLIPDAKDALQACAIDVGHAEILAKQTPAWQKKLLALPTGFYNAKGLWERKGSTIEFEDAPPKTKWDGVRAVSVREFESYVKTHVRFDAEHAAATSPLEYGETKQAIDVAQQRQKRGNKVVPISFEQQITMDARDKDGERTFCKSSWKKVGSKPCDKSVLGVVAAGEQYGRSFEVCVNKDCTVHWPSEAKQRAARKKEADKRASGASSTKAEKPESPEAKAKREAREAADQKKDEKQRERRDRRADIVGAAEGAVIAAAVKGVKTLNEEVLRRAAETIMRDCEDSTQESIDAVSKALGVKTSVFEWGSDRKALEKMDRNELVQLITAGHLLAETSMNRGDEFHADFVAACKAFDVDAKKVLKVALEQFDAACLAEDEAAATTAKKPAKTPAPAKAAKKAKKR